MKEGSMANNNGLKILMVATEAVPFAKEGGVADVMGSLPGELAAQGHDVRIFLPRYGSIDPARLGLSFTGVEGTVYMGARERWISILEGRLPGTPVTVY